MAIRKQIESYNGISLTYHRIQSIHIEVNGKIIIHVFSYIDDVFRNREKEGILKLPYHEVKHYELAYDENFSTADAYSYLKSLEEFSGAEDI